MGSDGTAGLPPRPDPQTGEPWPPHGLGYRLPAAGTKVKAQREKDRERDPRRKPDPPPGEGPVLAWYRHRREVPLKSGLGTFVFLAAWVVFYVGIEPGGIGMLRDVGSSWWLWIIPTGAGALMYLIFDKESPSAGAEWVKCGKKTWVRTYELRKVRARRWSTGVHVDLEDEGGRSLGVPLNELQLDRDVWDLLHNGMSHSVASGKVDINDSAYSLLGLQKVKPRDLPS